MKYEVDASPHKPTPPEILAEYKEKRIGQEALFEGKSLFEASERNGDIDAKNFRPKAVKEQLAAKDKMSAEDEAALAAGDVPF